MLESLEYYNNKKINEYKNSRIKPLYNGISCPSCSNELIDASNVELSSPFEEYPFYFIFCEKCSFQGKRIA